MTKYLMFFIFFFLSNVSAQQLHLKIEGKDISQNTVIDSISYQKKHQNAKSVIDETSLLAEKLSKIGYLESQIIENKKINDSTFLFQFDIGKQTKFIHINQPPKNETIILPYNKVEEFLQNKLNNLEKQGFGLSKLQLINIVKKKGSLYADLQIVTSKKRNINDFVIKGYDKFPLGYKKSLQRKYRNQIFNQDNLKKINADFNKIRFVKQTKYPEILFTIDSTRVFVYLEKAKNNSFDGFIGFTNDEQEKIILNGYLDLVLNNALNVGEKLVLNWKSDGKDQKTFHFSAEIPYIFNSPVALKTQLDIFKQDETFQNTKTAIDLGYFLNFNSKIFLGYQSTESNDIKNTNNSTISDYNNSYYTSSYEFINYKIDEVLFPEKMNFNLQIGTGKRNSKQQQNNQFFGKLDLNYHFYLTKKTAVNLKTQNFYLNSNSYIVNELYRFGGINSIRGFNENSLQANSFTSIITEYQYIISPSLYLHSILDYGYFDDKTTNTSGKLFGLGIGFGLQNKNGLLNFIYASGSSDNQTINSSNSIVHISLKTRF